MKFTINLIGIALFSFISGRLAWWEWDFVLIAFLLTFIMNDTAARSYAAGFLAMSTIWFFMANVQNAGNTGILSGMVAELFKLSSGTQLLQITALIGGVVGGFSAMTGSLARDVFMPARSRNGKSL